MSFSLSCQWLWRFRWCLVSVTNRVFVCFVKIVKFWGGGVSANALSSSDEGWPSRQAQPTASGPQHSQTCQGQRSDLAFLCPNPPWVPTYPLSRRSLEPVTHTATTFSLFVLLLFFSLTYLVLSSPFSLLLLSFLVNSWVDVPAGEKNPLLILGPPVSLLLYPSIHPPSVLRPGVALKGSLYPAAAEAGFICPGASFWKGIFCPLRIAHCLHWHWMFNCSTSKFGSPKTGAVWVVGLLKYSVGQEFLQTKGWTEETVLLGHSLIWNLPDPTLISISSYYFFNCCYNTIHQVQQQFGKLIVEN